MEVGKTWKKKFWKSKKKLQIWGKYEKKLEFFEMHVRKIKRKLLKIWEILIIYDV